MNTRKIQIYFFRILMILALALSLAGYTPGVSARVTDETEVVKPVELQQAPAYPIRDAGARFSHAETKYPIRAEANVPLSLTAANPVSTSLPENRHPSIELAVFDEPQAGLVEPLGEASEAVMEVAADAVGSNIMLASGASAKAKLASPFVGSWQAVDVDGSDMTLTIAGPPNGPFQITWTDNYISFCGGEAGLLRGTGVLNESDPNLLEADLHLECFTTGETLDLHLTLRYSAFTNTLGSRYEGFNAVTIWHRPGQELPPAPEIGLRVNYGHDWVESFYEAEHMVWLTVTDGDGNLKATADLVTEPKDFWGGETGFQTNPEDWSPAHPDIRPYDWVYAWVDNGAFAQVQIGEINGTIDVTNDSITGTVYAPWFPDNVEVEIDCHPWGAGMENEIIKSDWVIPDGVDTYTCAWDPQTEWDIQYYQDVGVGYSGLDGHWVANAFFERNPRMIVFPEGDYIEAWEWPLGTTVTLAINGELMGEQEIVMTPWGNPWNQWAQFGFGGQYDLKVGDVITITDGVTERVYTAEYLEITNIDKDNNRLAGKAAPGEAVSAWVWEFGSVTQTADENGDWTVTFEQDLVEGTCGRVGVGDGFGNDTALDWCLPNPHFTIYPVFRYIGGYEWPDGATVTLSVEGKEECSDQAVVYYPPGDPNTLVEFPLREFCELTPGDAVTLTDGDVIRTHIFRNLAIGGTDKDADTVFGTADFGAELHVWPHGLPEVVTSADDVGNWTADFTPVGVDLVEGMCGWAEIRDDFGNATAIEWCVPNPRIIAFPMADQVFGYDWPVGSEVSLFLNGAVEPHQTVVVGPAPWDPNDINAYFELRWVDDPYNLVAGDSVTLSGSGMERTYTVQNLAVTEVDKIANRVTGTADNGAVVYAWVHGYGETEKVLTVEDGTWETNYGDSFNLVEGMCGRAEIREEGAFGWTATTTVDWCIPNPRFSAFPEWEYVEGWDWPLGANIHLTIDDPATPEPIDYQDDQPIVNPDWDPNALFVSFSLGEYDLKVGDVVTLTEGVDERTHTVRNLMVGEVNEAENTVAGTADPDTELHVWPHGYGEIITNAGGDGTWAVDFDDIGVDLQGGMCGRAEIRDAEAFNWTGATAVDWCIPNPRLLVQITENWFVAQQFPPSVELTFNIYGLEGGDPLITGSMWTDPSGNASIWVGDQEGGDLQPGYLITVSDGMNNRSIVLEALTFDVFDLTNGHFEGTAPEPFGRTVWVGIGWENEGWSMEVVTDGTGNWSAEYGGPVPEGYQWVAAQVFDDDGDASEVRPAPVIEPDP